MKILYIGHYHDGTGWGDAAIHNILSLDTNEDVTVVPRAVSYNGYRHKNSTPERILELEDNDLSDIDVCVQHVLPTLYSYQKGFKNIGIYYSETNNIDSMLWQKYINMMDGAVVCNNQMFQAARTSGVVKPVSVCPIPIDYNYYQNIKSDANIKDLNTSFNFCFVGEMSKRKNITTLLRAFHTEFHPSENVNLFLKVHSPGLNSDQTLEQFDQVNNGVTQGLKIRQKYKQIAAVTGFMKKQDLLSILSQCHVFVCPSFGEAWCIPALESMALGLQVIYPADTGLEDFCHGWSINTKETICHGAIDTIPDIYSSHDTWQEMDILQLMYIMRSSYQAWTTMKDLFDLGADASKKKALQFDYKNIGKTLKEAICVL